MGSSLIGRAAKNTFIIAVVFSLFAMYQSLFIGLGHAADSKTEITSDTLEYFSETKKYIAKGTVKIKQDDASVEADEMVYLEKTVDVTAAGNAYNDLQTSSPLRLLRCIEKKTGKLYDADILFKEDNYRIKGTEIEKRRMNSTAETRYGNNL
jgi:lipopolysaccharide assembly outer membrane protein LptD (OstA)